MKKVCEVAQMTGMIGMKEEEMMRICLAGSIIGILVLYFIALYLPSTEMDIGEVTGNVIGSVVKVEGQVEDFYEHRSGHYFFDLADGTGKVRVVVWEQMVEELRLGGVNVSDIRDGARLEITGTVERYRGELELIPIRSQVRIISS